MKLTSLLVASSFLAASAFGVSPKPALTKPSTTSVGFLKESAVGSALFRDQSKVRGGAVPGWAAYNDALDKKPLVTKAMTSLVGWALGDLLAQVCIVSFFFLLLMFKQSSAFCARCREGNEIIAYICFDRHIIHSRTHSLDTVYFLCNRSSSAVDPST